MPDVDEGIWPLHWGRWRGDSRILMDIDKVLSGEVDVLAALSAIPTQRVREMQVAIATHAHRMHYGLVDTPGDALEILLHALADHANGATVNQSGVSVPSAVSPLDGEASLPSDCVDKNVVQNLVRLLPSSAQAELRSSHRTGETKCEVLVRLYVEPGADCNAAKMPSGKLVPLFVSDICARTCGLCKWAG